MPISKIHCWSRSWVTSNLAFILLESVRASTDVGQGLDCALSAAFTLGAHALELVDPLTELVDLRKCETKRLEN